MTYALFIFLIIQGAFALPEIYRWIPGATPEMKAYAESLEKPWGQEGKSAWESFGAIQKLIEQDPESKVIFEKVRKKLAGVKGTTFQDFIQFCGENGEADGGFSQDSEIVGVTLQASGFSSDLGDEEKEKIKNSHTYGTFDVPFLRFHLGGGKPSMCVDQDESIRSAYDIFMHEFIHFLEMNFSNLESMIDFKDFESGFQNEIFGKGGEIDAYRVGIGAEARLLGRLGIQNPHAHYEDFQAIDGTVSDEGKFRKYVEGIYREFYSTNKDEKIASGKALLNYRLQYLGVLPEFVRANGRTDLIPEIEKEKERIRKRLEELDYFLPE